MLKRKMSRRKEWDSCKLCRPWQRTWVVRWGEVYHHIANPRVCYRAFLMSYFHLLCASSFWMWLANLSLCTIANNASVSKTPALELWVTIDSFILSEDLWHDTVTHMNSDGGGIYKCKVLSNLLHSNCIVDILPSLVSIIMTCLWVQTAEVKLYQ